MDDKYLDRVELLMDQSLKGVHHLFDNRSIAEILKVPTEELNFFSYENMDKVHDLMSKLIEKSTFAEKMVFLSTLDKESYEILVRAYFHILENTVLAASPYKH